MRQNVFKRILLAITFIFIVISFITMFYECNDSDVALALPITIEEARTEYVDNMKYGYDVTSEISLLNDGLCKSNAILKPITEGLYKHIEKFNVTSLEASSFREKTTEEIANEYGKRLNAGLGTEIGKINSVSLDINTEFGLDKNRHQLVDEQFEIYYQRQKVCQYIIQDNVDLRQYITDNLKNDFKNINTIDDAIYVLKRYGTHLFTGFNYGGVMQVCNYQSTKKVEEVISTTKTLDQKMSSRISAFDGNQNFSFDSTYTDVENEGSRVSKYSCRLYGGVGTTAASVDDLFTYKTGPLGEQGGYAYEKWVDSINNGEKLAIVDIPASAKAIPLWELLPPDPQIAIKRNILLKAYAQMCGTEYDEYLKKYPLLNRQMSSGDGSTSSGKIDGYSLTYKGNSSYHKLDNSSVEHVVGKNSVINLKFTDNIPADGAKQWKVYSEPNGVVEVLDSFNGIFKVKDTAPNGSNFLATLYNGDDMLNLSIQFNVQTKQHFSGGDGSENNPYLISNLQDIKDLSVDSNYWSNNFFVTNDIDCSNSEIIGIGEANNPFSGSFDGNYCTIKNFRINKDRGESIGLFANTSEESIINNLFIDNAIIELKSIDNDITNCGIITGVNKGQINNCKINASRIIIQYEVSKEKSDQNKLYTLNLGSFAGKCSGKGSLNNCSLTGINDGKYTICGFIKNVDKLIKTEFNVGSIVGLIENEAVTNEKTFTLQNCYVNNILDVLGQGTAKEAKFNVGGFIGQIKNKINLKNLLVGDITKVSSAAAKGVSVVRNTSMLVGEDNKCNIDYSKCFVKKNSTLSSNAGAIEKDTIVGTIIQTDLSDPAWGSLGDTTFPTLKAQTFNKDCLSLTCDKTDYYYGEVYNKVGISVFIKNAFDNNVNEIKYYTVNSDNYKNDVPGTYKIIVNAIGYTTSYEVTVRNIKVVGLNIQLNKNQVYLNDPIQRNDYDIFYVLENGQKISINDPVQSYIDYPTKNPEKDIKVTADSTNYGLGDNKITVECNKLTSSTIVNAIENDVTKIEIKTAPTKKNYKVGEKFDPTGMEVQATYRNNEVKIVPNNELEIVGNSIAAGNNSVVLSYGRYKTCNYEVNGEDVEYTVKFLNDDRTVLKSTVYHYGDHVDAPENPTKASDNTYKYTFNSWDKEITKCKGNVEYIAVYDKTYIDYNVIFKDEDGNIFSTRTYHYGDTIIVPDTPTKKTDKVYSYTFSQWNKPVSTCTGDTTFIAEFNPTYIDYTIKFVNHDGTILSNNTYHYGDIVEKPLDPTKSGDVTYNYVFNGWDHNVVNCVGDDTYTATYRSVFKEYKVEFKNDDGTNISTMYYHYGDTIIEPTNVFKPSDAYTYKFKGWDKEITTCKGDVVYIATYDKIEREFDVKFVDYDGVLIISSKYHFGDTVVPPESPTRVGNSQYSYTFKGWDKPVVNCNGDTIYTAQYNEILQHYTVKFINYDNSVLSSTVYDYGAVVEEPEAPTKKSDETYNYIFDGWDKNVVNCIGDVTYTATYKSSYIDYVIVFKNDDGKVLSSFTYHYGDVPVQPLNVNKPSDNYNSYKFIGWDKPLTQCVGDETYIATYEPIKIEYTVQFLDYNGAVINISKCHYGDMIVPPANPIRQSSNKYDYVFTGWNTTITVCNGNQIYTAQYNEILREYTIKFVNYDNTLISSLVYHYGDAVEEPTAPTKKSDETYNYIFDGWDKNVVNCIGDVTYTATYKSSYIDYVVVFKNDNGDVISSIKYHYGDIPVQPSNVFKPSDNYNSYKFKGWDKEVVKVDSDTTYIATYDKIKREFDVKFVDYDGALIISSKYHFGDTVVPPKSPTRESNSQYSYTFKGWDKPIVNCNGDTIYTAQYNEILREYTIKFVNYDNSVLSSKVYNYGAVVEKPEAPTKKSDEVYSYEFDGWDKNVVNCTGDVTYTATYKSSYIDYVVVFKNDNGDVISSIKYHYGDMPVQPSNVFKTSDMYEYTFKGWDKEVVKVDSDATYIATYDTELIVYIVKFQYEDGTLISSGNYNFNDEISVPNNPLKEADNTYTYTFKNWDKVITNCKGNETYIAKFDKEYIDYEVVFKNWDGTVLSTQTYHYGDTIIIPDNPIRNNKNNKTYVFIGWDNSSTLCDGEMIITALFDEKDINSLHENNSLKSNTITKEAKIGMGVGIPVGVIAISVVIAIIVITILLKEGKLILINNNGKKQLKRNKKKK